MFDSLHQSVSSHQERKEAAQVEERVKLKFTRRMEEQRQGDGEGRREAPEEVPEDGTATDQEVRDKG